MAFARTISAWRGADHRWARLVLLAVISLLSPGMLGAQERDTRYRVQVEALADRETAVDEARRLHRLLEAQHSVYVFDASPLHAVRVGDFVSAPAARRLLLRLRALGFADAWLAKVRPDAPLDVLRAGETVTQAVESPREVLLPRAGVPPPVRVPAPRPRGVVETDRIPAPAHPVPMELANETPEARARASRDAPEGRKARDAPETGKARDAPRAIVPPPDIGDPRPAVPGPDPAPQDAAPSPVRALVVQVAGATLYLDAGFDAGIVTGDTVGVARDSLGSPAGRLVVIASTASRSVLGFAGEPFPLTRGQVLFVRPPRPAEAARIAEAGRGDAGRADVAGGARAADAERAEARRAATGDVEARPTVRGRISLDVDATRSTARYGRGDEQSVDRTFATPALRFRARVTDLPGDLQLHANTRLSYRYTDSPFPSDPTSARVYELSLVKSFRNAPLELRAGRFYNPYESYSGYWDGLLARVGTRSAGVGVALGFQPDRWNQGVSTDLPKLSVFADARVQSGRARYEIDVSAHRVQPDNGLFRHTFLGLSQRLRVGAVRLSQDLQVDEDPIEGGWDITRLRLNAGVDVHRKVTLRANISRDRPYRLWDTLTVISYPRDQVGAGLTVQVAGGAVGADVAVNRDLDDQIGRSYSSFFRFPQGGPLGLGVNGAARYWEGFGYRVLSLSPGLSRSFGSTRAQLSYRFYRSEYDVRRFSTHTVEGGVSVLVGRGLRYSLRASSQWSADLFSNRVYTGLSKNF